MNKRIKRFITKCHNKEKDAYCWINTNKKLSDEELSDIEKYFNNKNYNFMLIINGCSQLRPQRTWGTLPTFLKGIDGYHTILKNSSNAFILCSWLDNYDEYKDDIKELLDLPDILEVKVLIERNRENEFMGAFSR